jgi:hypothetical protein
MGHTHWIVSCRAVVVEEAHARTRFRSIQTDRLAGCCMHVGPAGISQPMPASGDSQSFLLCFDRDGVHTEYELEMCKRSETGPASRSVWTQPILCLLSWYVLFLSRHANAPPSFFEPPRTPHGAGGGAFGTLFLVSPLPLKFGVDRFGHCLFRMEGLLTDCSSNLHTWRNTRTCLVPRTHSPPCTHTQTRAPSPHRRFRLSSPSIPLRYHQGTFILSIDSR